MKEIKELIKHLRDADFRPENWREKISEKTGFSVSQVEKVFYGIRFNKEIALEIIRFFNEEKKLLQREIEEAKK